MNASRRKRIAQVTAQLNEAIEILQGVCEEEREAFEARSEGSRQSEAGQQSDLAIDNLESAAADLQSCIDVIEPYAN